MCLVRGVQLSERITRWRESRELTKAELARRVEVSPEAVTQWENGKTEPTHENVEKIARACELTLGEFWSAPPPPPKKREKKAS